jgi:hypothetical protein
MEKNEPDAPVGKLVPLVGLEVGIHSEKRRETVLRVL